MSPCDMTKEHRDVLRGKQNRYLVIDSQPGARDTASGCHTPRALLLQPHALSLHVPCGLMEV